MEGIVNACHMHVLLLYEVTSDPALAHLTPINGLRNAALLAVRTPLLVMVDVDLCVSASLVRFLSEPSNGDKLVASSSNTFWVLPAWDVSAGLSRVEIDHIAESALAGASRAGGDGGERRVRQAGSHTGGHGGASMGEQGNSRPCKAGVDCKFRSGGGPSNHERFDRQRGGARR